MVYDIDMLRSFYSNFPKRVDAAREQVGRPLTLAEKILYAHLYEESDICPFRRGEDYVNFRPDRVAMQDATAQMALLQFMNAGKSQSAVPATVHCDHLIQANMGAKTDIATATQSNSEVYDFLKSVSDKYGIGFWKPGAGIIHQVVLENYAFPGGMMIGTDSHTPNAGGLGMIAIGVGGADAVDVMTGMEWELKMPKLIGVKLTGSLSGWASPKDVILKLAGILTVKGGTNAIIEYFGPGAASLSATGKATICNMGAEVGATTSLFPFNLNMATYLRATGRDDVAEWATAVSDYLEADMDVQAQPDSFYDRVIVINLSELEPHINGPFTPDAATPISEFAAKVKENGWPRKMEVGLIGSCTNSSYEDFTRAASIAKQALDNGIKVKTPVMIVPGSMRIYKTLERDGILDVFEKLNATVLATACGPCIGQWKRTIGDPSKKNSIIESFNRNFKGRNDGSAQTHAFLASPEIVMAMAINGDLTFNPMKGSYTTAKGTTIKLKAPTGTELPVKGFVTDLTDCIRPDYAKIEIKVSPNAKRIKLLEPFPAWDGKDFVGLPILIKAKGKCTTDHISPGGKWLAYRGNLDRISDNLLERAVNGFTDAAGKTLNYETGTYDTPAKVARYYKNHKIDSIIIGDDNYGEGSSREHAAMEPRYLGVRVVLTKSLARIHESNLKKQGVLALTFVNPADYDKIKEKDRVSVLGLDKLAPGQNVTIELTHADGKKERFEAKHSYNAKQLAWFKAGSALNAL